MTATGPPAELQPTGGIESPAEPPAGGIGLPAESEPAGGVGLPAESEPAGGVGLPAEPEPAGFAAVVLAGGAARRMGGADKPALPVGGRPMVDRVLAAAADADLRIVVGPAGELPAGAQATRERPPGGGPVAALAAGLALLPATAPPDASATGTASPDASGPDAASSDASGPDAASSDASGPDAASSDASGPDAASSDASGTGTASPDASGPGTVALLAADLPLLTADAVRQLRTALSRAPGADGVVYVDDTGRAQFLCGVWRVAPLRAALTRLAAGRDGVLTGTSMRALIAELTVTELAWRGTGPPPWFDCDTEDDVRRAEEWIR